MTETVPTAAAPVIVAESGFDLRRLEASDRQAWESFVEKHDQSTFFHRWGWLEAIRSVHKHKTIALAALSKDGRLCGILPLVLIRSPLTGRALISTAFTVGGGILAEHDGIAHALAEEALAIGRAEACDYVELRSDLPMICGWQSRSDLYCGFEMPIGGSEEHMLKVIPRKRRAEIRKAIGFAGEGRLVLDTSPDVDRFHRLYAHALRDLGTPVFPRVFIRKLIKKFQDDCEIMTVLSEGVPVASLVSFYHKGTVMPYYVGALPQARGLRGFDYVYWCQILRAIEKGCTRFDFGRSKVGAGSFGFKKTWGIEPEPLTYQFGLLGCDSLPEINPNSPRYRLATRIWKKLPVPLATLGGAALARHFG